MKRGDVPSRGKASLGGVPARDGAESVLLRTRAAPVSVLLSSVWAIVGLGVLGAAGAYALVVLGWPGLAMRAAGGMVVLAVLRLVWAEVVRRSAEYRLTTSRAVWSGGVVGRYSVECPTERVQQISIAQGPLERLLGVGTVRIRTGAEGGPPVVWRWVADPEGVAERVRGAVPGYAASAALNGHSGAATAWFMGSSYPSPDADGRADMPVIGLAGGIGSGKSTVARAFQTLGCHVIDSDARAREALDRPEVSAQLVEWWGREVLDERGKVVRAKVAEIVFKDPDQRAKLEALVHPLVRQARARMIEEAARFWAKAAIVDAPLLFEAGVDKECDCVVYVDAPRDERVRRVCASRGWDGAELDRRESAQMDLDRKRALCDFVIDNSDDGSRKRPVREQAEGILRAVRGQTFRERTGRDARGTH